MIKKILLKIIELYLKSLPTDSDRYDFIDSMRDFVCLACGDLNVPDYCQWDE